MAFMDTDTLYGQWKGTTAQQKDVLVQKKKLQNQFAEYRKNHMSREPHLESLLQVKKLITTHYEESDQRFARLENSVQSLHGDIAQLTTLVGQLVDRSASSAASGNSKLQPLARADTSGDAQP